MIETGPQILTIVFYPQVLYMEEIYQKPGVIYMDDKNKNSSGSSRSSAMIQEKTKFEEYGTAFS